MASSFRASLVCFFAFFALFYVAGISAAEIQAQVPGAEENRIKRSFEKECASSYSLTCLKLDIVQWVDKLSDNKDLAILPGVTIVKEQDAANVEKANTVVAELAREFPNDPSSRLDAYLMKKITGYLGSHSIKLNLFDSKAVEAEFTGRGKGGGFGGGKGDKKGGGMGMILMMGGMMKSMMMTVALAALAGIAGKALMTALISLLLSGIIGIKSLTSGGGHSTYEVHAKPIYTSHHEHDSYGGGHSSYGRSFDAPLPKGLQPGFNPYPINN